MEWGEYENRVVAIGLHKVGKSPWEIFKLLKKLKISLTALSSALLRLEPWKIACSKDNHAQYAYQNLWKQWRRVCIEIQQRNSHSSWTKDKKRLSFKLSSDLGLHAYRQRKGHLLTNELKCQKLLKLKRLLKHYSANGHLESFSLMKRFSVLRGTFNVQNDRIYAKSSREAVKKLQGSRGVITVHQSWYGEVWAMRAQRSSISVKKGWKFQPKSTRRQCLRG